MIKSLFLLLFFGLTVFTTQAQFKFTFEKALKESPNQMMPFCIDNNNENLELIQREGLRVKYQTKDWLFVTTTPQWIASQVKDEKLKKFYFEYAPGVALADTAIVLNKVIQVHNGIGLESGYLGDDVIIGYVDQGIDWNHPDFKDVNGKTRVIRYWDHSFTGTSNSPYGYGLVWDSSAINNGTCTSIEEASGHGSTVTGMGSGNGLANGKNKGMAPNSKIISIETNFNLNNWTLTVADAIDYVFKVADTLGVPAVVNLSVGSYLGSHDGDDPASQIIEDLLDAKPGRIVVGAAGNSGAQGKYHCQNTITSDTSFVWFLNNSNSNAAFGPNHIYFDLWADTADANFSFAFQADLPAPNYTKRGRTEFKPAKTYVPYPILDTLYNDNGDRIATIELYNEIVGGNYHMEAYFSNVDSVNYLYRFMTTGSGKYDLWSGAWMGLNSMVTAIPSVISYPEIQHYAMPDTLQTIVSSWACSEKTITVANYRNRYGFIDKDMNQYGNTGAYLPQMLSPNSSKGPSRKGLVKPDLASTGDVTLASGPFFILNNPGYNSAISEFGWHVLNGGTSMATPVVSGSAALFLDRCRYANWQSFKTGLIGSSFSDTHTGALPNYAFGNGKLDAHQLLLNQNLNTTLPTINLVGNDLVASSGNYYVWTLNGQEIPNAHAQTLTPVAPYGVYSVTVANSDGCPSTSANFEVTANLDLIVYENIKLFPNPVREELKIQTDAKIVRVVITDETGRSVDFDPLNSYSLGVQSLTKGMYFISILTDQGIFKSKFIKL